MITYINGICGIYFMTGFVVQGHTYTYIQVHQKKKKIEYHEKGLYFLSLISEIETHILLDSLHMEWNMSSFHFLKFWWLWLADNENPKFSVSENLNIT